MKTVLITTILYLSLALILHEFTGCVVQPPKREIKKAERLPAQWWIPTIQRIDRDIKSKDNQRSLYLTLVMMLSMREENIWVEDDLHFFLFDLRKTMKAEQDEQEKAALKKLYDEFITFQEDRRIERQNAKKNNK